MKIGIISGCKGEEKKGLYSVFKHRSIHEKQISLKNAEITVCSVYCSGKRLEKKIKKAEEKLTDAGCSVVIRDDSLKTAEQLLKRSAAEKKMFLELALRLYKEYLKQLGLKAYKMKLLIADRDCCAVNRTFVERLCFYSSKCDILTNNIRKAEEICEYIFGQNGMLMEVGNIGQTGYDAVFDIDNMTFRIAGKVFIKNLDFGLSEFSEFNVSPLEIIEILEKSEVKFRYDKTKGNTVYFRR